MGIQLPPPRKKGTAPPNFWFLAYVNCGQTAGWMKMPLSIEVNLGPGDVVLDEVAVLPLKGAQRQVFGPYVYCGQTAGWMKMPLSTEIDLGPGHILLDRNPTPPPRPPRKGHSSLPLFSAHICCGHGRPSQLLLSFCLISWLLYPHSNSPKSGSVDPLHPVVPMNILILISHHQLHNDVSIRHWSSEASLNTFKRHLKSLLFARSSSYY